MAEQPIVAELGRPETAEETAARKAESSRIYRSSQSFRNLIAALIATLAVLTIIVFMVPRGSLGEPEAIDSVALAEQTSETLGREIFAVQNLPADWQTNAANTGKSGKTGYWKAVYSPNKDSKTAGFVNLEQSFNTDEDRAGVLLPGAVPDETTTIDGWTWTHFTLSKDAASNKNVTSALGTQIGDDYVLLYGNADSSFVLDFAADITAQISDQKEAQQ